MADLQPVLVDLAAEGAELDALVADLDAGGWRTPTPADGWTIADQIGHLAWTDELATVAAEGARDFDARLQDMAADLDRHGGDVDTYASVEAARWAALPTPDLLAAWRAGREILSAALRGVPSGQKLPWFGPAMSPTSMATARLMETWAHGQDVADALDVRRTPTGRLRHVAHLGVRTRDFSFVAHGLTPPDVAVRVDLTSPYGDVWTWGPVDAVERVTGSALDFCLLVTQRRHRDYLDVSAAGADAERWLSIAQAFAGLPGTGRPPRITS